MSKRDELGNDASAVKGLLGVLAAGLVTAAVQAVKENSKQQKIGELDRRIKGLDQEIREKSRGILGSIRNRDAIRQLEAEKARLKQEQYSLCDKKRW